MPFVNQRKSKVRLKTKRRDEYNNNITMEKNQQTKNCFSGEMKKLTNI